MSPDVLNTRRLPGRLTSAQAAALTGFGEHDLAILVAAGLIRPLGRPAPNAPKYWSSAELLELCSDRQWLDKATKAVSLKWKAKNEAAKSNQQDEMAA
jgi:hypothetical protein